MPNKERKGKWLPFDALEGYQQSLRMMEKEKSKKVKPVLAEDCLDEINELISKAVTEQLELEFEVFHDGELDKIKGKINKVDCTYRYLIVNSAKINFHDIVRVRRTG
ncbi:MAG: YolD-like family protein [Bacilli bacterium]|jgi:hypothetical protein|nr:YolD-like family protein [Bacilli bacterium]MDY0064257.1 YolD-like family protein [Bacilli bacterium]